MSLAPYRDKVLMKEALTAAGVAVPAFLPLEPVPPASEAAAEEILGALGPRIVVKPRREANNRGVAAIDSRLELERWLEAHAGEGGWEAESFLEGALFHAKGGNGRFVVHTEFVRPRSEESGGRPPTPCCEHRLEVLPAASPIAYSLLAWDPDLERLCEEARTAALRSG